MKKYGFECEYWVTPISGGEYRSLSSSVDPIAVAKVILKAGI